MACFDVKPEKKAAFREALNAMRKPKPTGYTSKVGRGIDINSKAAVIQKLADRIPGGLDATLPQVTIRKELERQGSAKVL